jgi:hypothetical protein
MALQHSPPNKLSASDTNIPASAEKENTKLVNIRKRKQPDNELDLLNEKFNQQMQIWDARITECIATAVSATLATEMTKFSNMLTEVNNSLIKLGAENVKMNKILTENTKKLDEMEKSINYISERQDDFDRRLTSMEGCVPRMDLIECRANNLEQQVAIMEQQARQCNIEISNMPERRGENLLNTVQLLGEILKCPIQSSDVIAVHRVPHADSKNPRPRNVIAKLSSRILRDNVLSAYRTNKGLDSNKLSIAGAKQFIYLNEHLTLNNKILFRQSRDAAKKYNYKFVWVKHGIILVRKTELAPIFAIRSLDDISKIK